MTKLTLPRAATQVVALLCCCLLVWASPASAFTAANTKKGTGEQTPLNLGSPSPGSHPSSGGASIVRTIVGLAIVLGVIWGLSWILRQVKGRRDPRVAATGLTSVAALPLSSGRSVHLVRAGNDYLLLGSAEHGLMPIHRYTEQQALEAGLLSPEEPMQPRKRRINLGLLAPPSSQVDDLRTGWAGPHQEGEHWLSAHEGSRWPERSATARPVAPPMAVLPRSTPERPRPTRTLESGERQSDPMHMPSVSSSLIERLRELTVRR
ncbi:MAG TPA: flagellar biosynthetic protein FliO [Solirubrobacteraceae bacterium]|jgi:flagellar protein FliO/FliZ|nr:flagellar biosynthetic protein FliO [Solirubrobacteraceae bacterium]